MYLSKWLSAAGAALIAAGAIVATSPASFAAFLGTNNQVAFVSTRNGGPSIFLVNAEAAGIGTGTSDPANTHQLTDAYSPGQTTQGIDSEPFFSPDGTKVVFASNRNGNSQIFLISSTASLNGDGSDNAVLISQPTTDHTDADFAPTFSPDGCTVVFNRGNTALYTVNSCASTPSSTVVLLKTVSLLPASSSDDSASRAVFHPADPTQLVYADGTGHLHHLTGIGGVVADTDISAATIGTGADANPDWVPDGSQIIFDSTRGGTNHQLYVMTPDGTTVGTVFGTNTLVSDTQPIFSPDGSMISFTEPGQSGDVKDAAEMAVVKGTTGLFHGSRPPVDLTLVGTTIAGPLDSQPDWQPIPNSPNLPEAPYAVLLPGGALLGAGLLLGLRRRRMTPGAI